jgi:predicted metal-dependent hydrolase
MSTSLKYVSNYAANIQQQIQQMVEQKTLGKYLLSKYPTAHNITNEKSLRQYVNTIKNQYIRKSAPLSKVQYDDKIHVVNNALGLHSFVSRVQGNKLKSKNEIRIATMFKSAPEAFLEMIAVHELAHLKEKDHNKAFYQLCLHMQPNYHQVELDVRIYLIQLEVFGKLY